MRNIPFLLLSTLLLNACTNKGNSERTVTAHIEDAAGRTLYFDHFANNQPVHLDSVVLDAEGKGVLRLPAQPLDFYGLNLGDRDMLVLVLDSNESVTVKAKAGAFSAPESVTDSAHSEALHGFFDRSRSFNTEKEALIARARSNNNDSVAIDRIAVLNNEFYEHCKRFAADNSSSPAALAAMNYMNPHADLALFVQVRDAMRHTAPGSAYYNAFRMQVDRAEKEVAAQRAQEAQMARMEGVLSVGSEAPDFAQNTPAGKPLSLSSLRGKVVLIDFWASWCKPCRIENPHVKKVYDKYKGRGFEILGVSLDRDHGAWTKAIADDGLPWKHVSDLAAWNNAAAQQYGVASIPFTVLVDKEGKVIAKNLRGPALEAKLAEVFP